MFCFWKCSMLFSNSFSWGWEEKILCNITLISKERNGINTVLTFHFLSLQRFRFLSPYFHRQSSNGTVTIHNKCGKITWFLTYLERKFFRGMLTSFLSIICSTLLETRKSLLLYECLCLFLFGIIDLSLLHLFLSTEPHKNWLFNLLFVKNISVRFRDEHLLT